MKTSTNTTIGIFLTVLVSLSMLFVYDTEQSYKSSHFITGAFSVVDVAPNDFTAQQDATTYQEATQQDALISLEQATQLIQEMRDENLTTPYAEDTFKELKQSYTEENYPLVVQLEQLLQYVYTQQLEFPDRILLLKQKISLAQEQDAIVNQSQQLILQAQQEFQVEQYDAAIEKLQQAATALEEAQLEQRRISNVVNLGQNLLRRYWWQSILVFVIILLFSYVLYKHIHRKKLKKRKQRLEIELSETMNLMKQLQHKCFIEKKITTATYKNRAAQYEERMAEIKHTLPVIEARLSGKNKKQAQKSVSRAEKRRRRKNAKQNFGLRVKK